MLNEGVHKDCFFDGRSSESTLGLGSTLIFV